MIYEELASLSSYGAESRPTAALAARAEDRRRRLRILQEEDVRRLSEAASRDRPRRHEEVDQLLKEYGYTPRPNSTLPASDS